MSGISNVMHSDKKSSSPMPGTLMCPANDPHLEVLRFLLDYFQPSLFDKAFHDSFVLLSDKNLTLVSCHPGRTPKAGGFQLSTGLSFQEKYVGRTSLSEAFKRKQAYELSLLEDVASPFSGFTTCTVPICMEKRILAFLSVFIPSSPQDALLVRFFHLFAEMVESNFKLELVRSKVTAYIRSIALPEFPFEELSSSEKDVLNHLKKGCSNREISYSLFISENTTKSHVQQLTQKLSCANRTQAAVNTILHEIDQLIQRVV